MGSRHNPRHVRAREPRYVRALPAYPGGKRRLLPAIFGLIDEALPDDRWPESTLADPFLGGGAVALSAKARGFGAVLANDVASRSVTVGRALIENSRERLTATEILDLLTLNRPGVQEAAPTKASSRLPADLENFFVRSLDATSDLRSPRRDLLRLFLVKLFLSFFPMSLPAATDAGHCAGAD